MLEEERRRALENLIHESEESGLYDKPRPTDLAERLREGFPRPQVWEGDGTVERFVSSRLYDAIHEAADALDRLSALESAASGAVTERRVVCPSCGVAFDRSSKWARDASSEPAPSDGAS